MTKKKNISIEIGDIQNLWQQDVTENSDAKLWKENFQVKQIQKIEKFKDLPENGYMPLGLKKMIFNDTGTLSLNGIRVVLMLILNLKSKQMYKKDELVNFDEDWFNSNVRYVTEFKCKLKDFLPLYNQNTQEIRAALKELVKYTREVKFEIELKNGIKKEVKLTSSIINNLLEEEEGDVIKFTINAYWYRLFLNIQNYKIFKKGVTYSVNTMYAMIWLFFIKYLPSIRKEEDSEFKKIFPEYIEQRGGKISIKKLNEILNTNYKESYDIKRRLLDPIKFYLDESGDISFNYKIVDDIIYIITYETSRVLEEKNDIRIKKIKNKIMYRIMKYNLTPENVQIIISTYYSVPFDIIDKAVKRNKELQKLKGKEYAQKFWDLSLIEAKKNNINLNSQFRDFGTALKNSVEKSLKE